MTFTMGLPSINKTNTDISNELYANVVGQPSTNLHQPLTAQQPYWIDDVICQVRKLWKLPQNWDSRGAKRIDKNLLETIVKVLSEVMRASTPPPCMIPMSCGGVQLEWHMRGMDLEVEFRSSDDFDVFCEDHFDSTIWEGSFAIDDLVPLVEVIAKLTSRL